MNALARVSPDTLPNRVSTPTWPVPTFVTALKNRITSRDPRLYLRFPAVPVLGTGSRRLTHPSSCHLARACRDPRAHAVAERDPAVTSSAATVFRSAINLLFAGASR